MADDIKYHEPRTNNPQGLVSPASNYPVGHDGPAGSPQRTRESISPLDTNLHQDSHGNLVSPDAPQGQPGQPLQVSPPPENPDLASQVQELNQKYGELVGNVGKMKDSYELQIQELELRAEMAQVMGRSAPNTPPMQIPAGVDPKAEVTVENLIGVLNNVIPSIGADAAAQGIRAAWDVSAAEEAAVLEKFPQVSNYPEPDKTRYILRAAKLMRPKKVESIPPSTPEKAASVPQAPQQVRPAAPTVPQPEATSAEPLQVPQQMDPLQAAHREYLEAENLPARTDAERKERLRKMRVARDKMMAAQGVSSEDEKYQGFRQSA